MRLLLRFDATLRNFRFSDLADEIILTDIVELPPEEEVISSKRALRAGTHVTDIVRRSLPIRLSYVIRTQDPVRRAALRDRVAKWVGNGGVLSISTRPDYYINVKPTNLPALNSSLRWAEEQSILLTAYEQPYWYSFKDNSYQLYGDTYSSEISMYTSTVNVMVPGDVDYVPCNCMVSNFDDTYAMTKLKLENEMSMLELSGFVLLPGEGLYIGYAEDDILLIKKIGSQESLLHYRTAESSDDFLTPTNVETPVTVSSNAQFQCALSFLSRWK